jgi:hypothetical protein
MPLVISQVAGLILARYVIGLEPIASMPADTVVATYAPVIQHYLTGDLGTGGLGTDDLRRG